MCREPSFHRRTCWNVNDLGGITDVLERSLDTVEDFVHDAKTQFDGKRLPRSQHRTTHCHACLCAWEEGDDDEDGNDASNTCLIIIVTTSNSKKP